jgi:hypothetical protein
MPLEDYLAGAALFAVMLAAVGVATGILVRRRLAHLDPLERLLAGAVAGTALLIGVHLVPLTLAILTRGTVLATAGLVLLAATRIPAARPAPDEERPPVPASPRALWWMAAVAAGFALLAFVADLRSWGTQEVVGLDPLTFHLPDVGRWIQDRSLWQIDQFLPLLAHGNYPNNGDVVLLSAVLPWHNDFLARFVIAAFVVTTAVAVAAVARELRAPTAASVLAGTLIVTTPVVGLAAIPRALPDSVLYATFACGTLFLLRHARTGRRSDLVLAGVGLGVAFGTKWYGVSSVLALIVVWVGARLLARHPVRAVLRDGALVGALSVAGGLVWFARNLVESDNPVFPVKIAALGVTLFDAPRDVLREQVGWSIAHYADQPSVLGDLAGELVQGLGLAGIACALGLGAAAWAGGRGIDRRVRAAIGAAAILACVYVITPATALGLEDRPTLADVNTRYAMPALLIAAPVTAWAIGRVPRAGLWLGAAVVLCAITGGQSGFAVQGASSLVKAAVGVAALAGAGRLLWRWLGPDPRRRPLALGATVAAVGLVALAGGYQVQKKVNETRYVGFDPAIDTLVRVAPEHRRIGLAGVWSVEGLTPVWPAFGMRIRNDVEFVGRFVEGFLTAYGDRRAFTAALRDGDYDVVVVGRGLVDPPRRVPAERWALGAGWRTIGVSDRLRVLAPPRGG